VESADGELFEGEGVSNPWLPQVCFKVRTVELPELRFVGESTTPGERHRGLFLQSCSLILRLT